MRNLYPHVKILVPADDKQWLRFDVSGLGAIHPKATHAYPAQAKILKPLKHYGRRADFVRFCGFGADTSYSRVMSQFTMSRANVAAFLRNLHKDHGIGFVSDGAAFRLVLPAGTKPAAIWRCDQC